MVKTEIFRENIRGEKFAFVISKERGSDISKNYYNVIIYKEGKGFITIPSATYHIDDVEDIDDAFFLAFDKFIHDNKEHLNLI